MTRLLSALLLTLPCAASAAPPPAVTATAYHPNGKVVAFGTHGEVRLFDSAKADALGTVSAAGRITALAFDPQGKWLAAAAGEPGKSGVVSLFRLDAGGKPTKAAAVTIPANKDSVFALAFTPDGRTLATTGYDRVIHVWDVPTDATAPKAPRLTLKDHSDVVYALAFNHDGSLLASGSADRSVKVWDAATGKRLYTLGDPTDWVYCLAWSPDKKHLAAGGVDKSVRVWAADKDGGKLVGSAFAHVLAVWRLAYSPDGTRLYTVGEDRVVKAWDATKLTETKTYPAQPEAVLDFALRPDGAQVAAGRFDGVALLLDPQTGKPNATPNLAAATPGAPPAPKDRFPVVKEAGTTDSARVAQLVTLPVTVVGAVDRAGDADFFRFEAKAGDQIGIEAVTAGSKLDPVLVLTDAGGAVLAEGGNLLGFRTPTAGTYSIGVRDRDYRGGGDFTYRLSVGDIPVVTGVFPLAAQRGRTTEVHVEGVNLGAPSGLHVNVAVPADAAVGSRVPVPLPEIKEKPLGAPSVTVSEFPSVVIDPAAGADVRVPGSADGIFTRPGQAQSARFAAKKGERLVVEVLARRAGSPVDPVIEIFDSSGKPVRRATLRCVAKTFSTLRDHDSAAPGIRLETWNELAIDDYLLADGELMRIVAMPKNPDDDCQFYQVGGQRVGYLGTTPNHHALGTPMYKVEIHPPGAAFPPNGLPVVPVHYRNDDGGAGFGKDSFLMFEPPADGEYQVRVTDARNGAGPTHAFRVTVRPPEPDFAVSFTPNAPSIHAGGGLPINVTLTRIDGFEGRVRVRFEGLPAGLSAPETFIEAGHTTTALTLFAEVGAKVAADTKLRMVARSESGGKDVVREFVGGAVKVVPVGDIVTTTRETALTLKPGQETKFVVDIARQGKFAGRVPVEVRGLPHGVRVLNIGLNGILVTERETTREIMLYAEPWVKPMERPIVVFARREGTNAEHAARSVQLKIEK
ncbi:wd40 repeat-containing protein : WD40 repeat-containing protein OS=Singulisphaera acidiphila (strain ATCC BAA-1392 / DSM 18658 / VKM B-2454 / MOB10) GN=Sinac_1517 PE=4 SV=1: WD40: WD40: WD40: WD40 [Gemmataceae bacterium]|nr:wd40 repeat-containing protein : WD40 repeat-containing protein OS=Singulisphaera acidiphila (strain ATCC BAA-1392 / DSM 18658 / VKM B-2454 / MOB10) GN=Sinac_1517 PE=4 SV=1: WD40: WD40: WD40: WD40 [Gemmataceae bacterium]VTT98315.1 wd40 repeat-containing protein : WD40 repeat-containing protein OS=Singulisphaera acidiphila (strain ATCC BAA-1392 / DSM 18658 / VKM B-2454 / MOB10) GN=Sinac_1517 PE=4 SV=1: WD40: WD40: WD40: WD40 [Gemmataceae bacterium]